jgi:hypothetical protein
MSPLFILFPPFLAIYQMTNVEKEAQDEGNSFPATEGDRKT